MIKAVSFQMISEILVRILMLVIMVRFPIMLMIVGRDLKMDVKVGHSLREAEE
jgi:hypothetical protein